MPSTDAIANCLGYIVLYASAAIALAAVILGATHLFTYLLKMATERTINISRNLGLIFAWARAGKPVMTISGGYVVPLEDTEDTVRLIIDADTGNQMAGGRGSRERAFHIIQMLSDQDIHLVRCKDTRYTPVPKWRRPPVAPTPQPPAG